jgi:hypothetical protein
MLRKSADKHRNDTRPGRRRFGVYQYLTDLYQVYLELRSRRIARKATRRIAKQMHLSIRSNSHPIRILIEATVVAEDNRTKSRWTQALKYAAGWRQRPERLNWFFKECRGIAGCARKYALNKKAARRKSNGGQNHIIHPQHGLGEPAKLNIPPSDGLKFEE